MKQHAILLARANVAAAIATGFDFASYVALVSLLALAPAVATAAGCVVGGVVNFVINRLWTFDSDGRLSTQIIITK